MNTIQKIQPKNAAICLGSGAATLGKINFCRIQPVSLVHP
jgi:hypothetical protein